MAKLREIEAMPGAFPGLWSLPAAFLGACGFSALFGGGWLSIVHGFAGMRTLTGELSFEPYCPEKWDGYEFKLKYRGRLIKVIVDKENVEFALQEGDALDFTLYGEKVTLTESIKQAIQK
ncbi:MAG: glycosyl hydrolase family 65 protein [Alkalibacterium sp.]